MSDGENFCAQCLDTRGPFVFRPYGKDDAMVRICERCENELPRVGGHNTKRRR